jgi:hypothetical protein
LKFKLSAYHADSVVMVDSRDEPGAEMIFSKSLNKRTKLFKDYPVKPAPRISQFRATIFVIFLALVFAMPVLAQSPITGILTAGLGDVAALKENAEAGSAEAQLNFGILLASRLRQKEALDWYRKAAAQGSIEAELRIGEMLLFGANGFPTNSVQPNPAEGLRWTFMAATNRHPSAYNNMSKALRQGLGTSPDPVAAYAWLLLLSETPTGALLGRLEMNELALKMDTTDIRRAQNLAAEWRAGHWQAPVIPVSSKADPGLKLNGIVFGMTNSQAVINGQTLEEGESATFSLKPGPLNVKCLKIQKDSVLISIAGEDQPRILRLSR